MALPTPEEIEESLGNQVSTVVQKIRLNLAKKGSTPAIAIWGDSHLAAGFFTEEMIAQMGLGKEQVKPGFLPPTMGRPGVRLPIRKYCKSAGWSLTNAYVGRGEPLKFGPALTYLENNKPEAFLWVDFRNTAMPALNRLKVHLRPVTDMPVQIEVIVDDNPAQQLQLAVGETELVLDGAQAFSTVKFRVLEGSLGIEGFEPLYASESKLLLDVFGIPGATARAWKVLEPAYLKSHYSSYDYDLVILEYGTNEGADRHFDAASYRASLSASLSGMRSAFPTSQCLLIGPTDRGTKVKKRVVTDSKKKKGGHSVNAKGSKPAKKEAKSQGPSRAELLKYAVVHAQISDVQRSVAKEFGCAFWDWQAAMGGAGGAYKWLFRSPPLMAKDLIHLTKPGYQESARIFVENTGIKDWLP